MEYENPSSHLVHTHTYHDHHRPFSFSEALHRFEKFHRSKVLRKMNHGGKGKKK